MTTFTRRLLLSRTLAIMVLAGLAGCGSVSDQGSYGGKSGGTSAAEHVYRACIFFERQFKKPVGISAGELAKSFKDARAEAESAARLDKRLVPFQRAMIDLTAPNPIPNPENGPPNPSDVPLLSQACSEAGAPLPPGSG